MKKSILTLTLISFLMHIVGCSATQIIELNNTTSEQEVNKVVRIETKDKNVIDLETNDAISITMQNDSLKIIQYDESKKMVALADIDKAFVKDMSVGKSCGLGFISLSLVYIILMVVGGISAKGLEDRNRIK